MRCASVRLYACAIGFAAMAAAASGHAAVYILAYLRMFSGAYAGYRHGGIVAAVAAVAAVAFGFAALTVITATLQLLRRSSDVDRHAVLGAMPRLSPKAVALVFCLQIPTLLGIEALEQIQLFGHPLGIAASLGGPPLVSLAIHAICSIAIAILSFGAIRAVAKTALTLARIVAPLTRRAAIAAQMHGSAETRTANTTRRSGLPAPLALRIANRPPPHFAIS
jgi:hypothetical protein